MGHLKLSYRRFKLFTAVLDQCETYFYVVAPYGCSELYFLCILSHIPPIYITILTDDGNNKDPRNIGNTVYTYTTLSPTQRIPIIKNLISSKSQCYGTSFIGIEAPSVT